MRTSVGLQKWSGPAPGTPGLPNSSSTCPEGLSLRAMCRPTSVTQTLPSRSAVMPWACTAALPQRLPAAHLQQQGLVMRFQHAYTASCLCGSACVASAPDLALSAPGNDL